MELGSNNYGYIQKIPNGRNKFILWRYLINDKNQCFSIIGAYYKAPTHEYQNMKDDWVFGSSNDFHLLTPNPQLYGYDFLYDYIHFMKAIYQMYNVDIFDFPYTIDIVNTNLFGEPVDGYLLFKGLPVNINLQALCVNPGPCYKITYISEFYKDINNLMRYMMPFVFTSKSSIQDFISIYKANKLPNRIMQASNFNVGEINIINNSQDFKQFSVKDISVVNLN